MPMATLMKSSVQGSTVPRKVLLFIFLLLASCDQNNKLIQANMTKICWRLISMRFSKNQTYFLIEPNGQSTCLTLISWKKFQSFFLFFVHVSNYVFCFQYISLFEYLARKKFKENEINAEMR